MISESRKKVLLDLFGNPLTLFPAAGGLTCFMLSWAIGGSALLTFFGFAGLLIAVGGIATRLSKINEMIAKQRQYEHEEIAKKQDADLDDLDSRLIRDRDPRDQACLREIRQLYSSVKKDVKSGNVSPIAYQMLDTIEELFQACVAQLEHTYDLWESSRKLRGRHKKKITKERERLIAEVEDAVVHLAEVVQQFHLLKNKKRKKDLSVLRERLDQQIKVARKAEQKRVLMENPSNAEKEFETFMKEES